MGRSYQSVFWAPFPVPVPPPPPDGGVYCLYPDKLPGRRRELPTGVFAAPGAFTTDDLFYEPTASRLIQHLNFVVSITEDAVGAAGQGGRANRDEDDGVPWIDDPSTGDGWATTMGPGVGGAGPEGGATGTPAPTRPVPDPGYVRRVPPGGSGMRPTRRRPVPVFRVTITADDQSKDHGTVFTWDGDEYADSGLL